MADSDHSALVAQFIGITGATSEDASAFLAQVDWNLQDAIINYHLATEDDANDENLEPMQNADDDDTPAQGYSGGGARTLGGDGVPSRRVPGDSLGRSSSQAPRGVRRGGRGAGGPRTLKDLQSDPHADGHGHSYDGDDDDESEGEQQEFYTGGDKSGLAVQKPNSAEEQINRVLKRAQRGAARPGGDDVRPPRPSHFGGRGQTLGGDEAESQVIEPIVSSNPAPPPRAHRALHLWRNGFSIDDGPLYRFDDPANAQTLEMINRGRAPLDLLNLQHGQEVDLQLHPHREEDYKPPKKKYQPFGGTGQRLGSPTPDAGTSTATIAAASAPATAPSVSNTSSVQPFIDPSVPTLTLQIRLGDGTRMQSRFNTTHTVGDVYSFVNASSTADRGRNYVLMTTFPNKDLSDKGAVLGDMSELKRGGVVVQKWT